MASDENHWAMSVSDQCQGAGRQRRGAAGEGVGDDGEQCAGDDDAGGEGDAGDGDAAAVVGGPWCSWQRGLLAGDAGADSSGAGAGDGDGGTTEEG